MKIAIVLGTRPEIIKMSPVIRCCEKRGNINCLIIHTGQHYSYNLDRVFFEQLNLPQPGYNLEVGSGLHGEQTGKILIALEKALLNEKPDIVLVEGDTNSVFAGALAATKLGIRVGHVEAGLRSYDRTMPEEINRILADHCSDYLFTPTENARKILLSEGIADCKIFVTGNTIVDAVYQNAELSKKHSETLNKLNIKPAEYCLTTIHRQENVDFKTRFAGILRGLDLVRQKYKIPVIYPIHPRSKKMLSTFNLSTEATLIEPVDFLDFLYLENHARLILTDSGGVQEEACILGVPCVTLRDNTERPETIQVGANILAGTQSEKILECSERMITNRNRWINPFGDGKASERIINIISEEPYG